MTAAISELTTLILSAQDTAGQCPLNTLENIGRHREELGEVVWNTQIYSNLVSASNKINKTWLGLEGLVIFSVKEYTNNELTKTKNKKKQNKTK